MFLLGGDNSKWLFGYSLSSDFNSAAPLWWPRVYSGRRESRKYTFHKRIRFQSPILDCRIIPDSGVGSLFWGVVYSKEVVMTHSKTPLPSSRLIRSPSNLVRRKNINFDSVPGSSQELPGSFPGSFPPKGRKPAKWI